MTEVKTFHFDHEQVGNALAYAVEDVMRGIRFHVAGLVRDCCWHGHLSWPIHDVQHCMACSGSWHYDSRRMQRRGRMPGLPRPRKGTVLAWPNPLLGAPESHTPVRQAG